MEEKNRANIKCKKGDVICEGCGVIMKSCDPYEDRNLCVDCIKRIKCKPELNESYCGNKKNIGNFWIENQNDNIAKFLEGE